MLNYKQIWHGIKQTRWLIKFNLAHIFMNLDFCELELHVKLEYYGFEFYNRDSLLNILQTVTYY